MRAKKRSMSKGVLQMPQCYQHQRYVREGYDEVIAKAPIAPKLAEALRRMVAQADAIALLRRPLTPDEIAHLRHNEHQARVALAEWDAQG